MTDTDVKYTAIAYTDGSANPNPGLYGGGCHGYLFSKDDYKKNSDAPNGFVVTNEGYKEKRELNDNIRVVKPSYYYNSIYPYGTNGTNNQAELRAITDTIMLLTSEYPVNKIIIYSDSAYAIGMHMVISKDLVERKWLDPKRPNMNIAAEHADVLLTVKDVDIDIRKILAHGTAIGNNTADRLAYAAREASRSRSAVTKYKFYTGRYWKDKITPHPMLNFKQIYFNSGIAPDTSENIYVIMDYPKDVEVGNKSNEPLFGISIFKNKVDYINNIMDLYLRKTQVIQTLMAVDLRVVHSQPHLKMTEVLGENAYNIVNRNRLWLLDEDTVVTPITPVGLARAAMSKTLNMYTRYREHLATEGMDNKVMLSVDVTNQLYDINPKGKLVFKYLANIPGPKVSINLDNRDIDITLVYGKDILTRNQLKQLEKYTPKIYLAITRLSDKSFEYYTIIETSEASGIYGNYYINKVYL